MILKSDIFDSSKSPNVTYPSQINQEKVQKKEEKIGMINPEIKQSKPFEIYKKDGKLMATKVQKISKIDVRI